jgi:hypothetical protein
LSSGLMPLVQGGLNSFTAVWQRHGTRWTMFHNDCILMQPIR